MKAQVISFRCTLMNTLGHVLSISVFREVINELGLDNEHLSGLVEGLQDVKPGERRRIAVKAERAYGFYLTDLVRRVPRGDFKNGYGLELGDEIELLDVKKRQPRTFRVVSVASDSVVIDGNHPLAGLDLVFDVEILAARNLGPGDRAGVAAASTARHLH